MYIRKIAAAACFATGAAVAFAPFASADPVEITSTVSGEISSMNSLFDFEALLAGKSADVIAPTASDPFATIPLADAPQVAPLTTLDYELYGVDPLKAGPASDPGSFEVFNGALGKFDDAYNVYLYAAENNGAMDMNDADFIGSQSSIDHAQTLTVSGAEQYFLNFGSGDLAGYFGIFPPATEAVAGASTAAVDPTFVTSTLDSEIASENSLFEFEALLAGDSADVTKGGAGVFDTIDPSDVPKITDPADASQLTTLEYELYGVNPIAAGISSDSGPYSEFNGALTEFDNAYNVEVYSLFNGGALDTNVGDYIENSSLNHALTLTDTTAAFDYLWNFGVGDLSAFSGVDLSFLDIGTAI
jgi:hypothetical protein